MVFLIVKPKFAVGDERPDELLNCSRRTVFAGRQKLNDGLDFLELRLAREHGPKGTLDQLIPVGESFENADEPVLRVSQIFAFDLRAVAEQERLTHSDLKVLARNFNLWRKTLRLVFKFAAARGPLRRVFKFLR